MFTIYLVTIYNNGRGLGAERSPRSFWKIKGGNSCETFKARLTHNYFVSTPCLKNNRSYWWCYSFFVAVVAFIIGCLGIISMSPDFNNNDYFCYSYNAWISSICYISII